MSIKRLGAGSRNIENFKKATFCYCGELDRYPRYPGIYKETKSRQTWWLCECFFVRAGIYALTPTGGDRYFFTRAIPFPDSDRNPTKNEGIDIQKRDIPPQIERENQTDRK